jgi:alpha-tubulin suppressor-like RCC1 family protein
VVPGIAGAKQLFMVPFPCAVDGKGDIACGDTDGHGAVLKPALGPVARAGGTWGLKLAVLPSGGAVAWELPGKKPARMRALTGLSSVVDIAAAIDTVCAVQSSGKVVCLGLDDDQEFEKPLGAPTEVPGLGDAVSIASDLVEYCATRRSGDVTCWDAASVPKPAWMQRKTRKLALQTVAGLQDVAQVAILGTSWMALHKDGTVSAWGQSIWGQLGFGDYESREAPAKVPGLSGIVSIALASQHGCALRTSGEVLCGGEGESGAIGQSTPAHRFTPVAVLAAERRSP